MNENRVHHHIDEKPPKRDFRVLDSVEQVVLDEARAFAALANDIHSCCSGLLDGTEEVRAKDLAKACLEAALNRTANIEEIYDICHDVHRDGAKLSRLHAYATDS